MGINRHLFFNFAVVFSCIPFPLAKATLKKSVNENKRGLGKWHKSDIGLGPWHRCSFEFCCRLFFDVFPSPPNKTILISNSLINRQTQKIVDCVSLF